MPNTADLFRNFQQTNRKIYGELSKIIILLKMVSDSAVCLREIVRTAPKLVSS